MEDKNIKPTEKTEEEDLLKLLNSRLKLAKRFGKNFRKEAVMAIKDYDIESFDEIDHEDLYNKLQIPYIFSTVESGIPSMFETMPQLIMTQMGREDREFTDWVNVVWRYTSSKVGLDEKIEDFGFSFLTIGMGNLKYGWVTETEEVDEPTQVPLEENGQPVVDINGQPVMNEVINKIEVTVKDLPVIDIKNYNEVFYSPESKFCIDDSYNKIPYIFLRDTLDKDAIEFYYKKDIGEENLSTVKVSGLNDDEEDDDSKEALEIDGILSDDLERSDVYTYYGVLPKKYVSSTDENWRPDKVYKITFIKTKLLDELEVYGKKPVLQLGNYGSPTKFWKFGEAKVLRELEQDVSLGRSTMADYRDRLSTKVAVPNGSEFDEESFRSPKKFTQVKFIGDKLPQYITPPPVPEVVIQAMQQSRGDIQMSSGQLDVSRGGDTNTVNTATGQKIFQNVHEKRIGRKRKKIGRLIEAIAKNILPLCAENWDLEMFAKITDMPQEDIEKFGFIEKLKKVGEEYDVSIDVEDQSNNKEAVRASSIAMFRELKDVQEVNKEELVKWVIKTGFDQKDVERFLVGEPTPEQLMSAINALSGMGFISPEVGGQMAMAIQQQGENPQASGQMGRPATQDPTQVVEDSMPGTDQNQMEAQASSAYKQTGVSK